MNTDKSQNLFEKAKHVVPGGVNSPVRAFKAVGGSPRFIDRGQGAYIWDADGNRFIDYVLSWGPLILGHAHPLVVSRIGEAAKRGTSFGASTALELELANRITELFPSIDMVRMVNSGTEATMSALRLARGYTKRDKIIKFAGCYHGHADTLLAEAGSGVATLGIPGCPGVPAATVTDTLIANYNDLDSVQTLFRDYPGEIAAVVVEPIAGNMGFIAPESDFLAGLTDLTRRHGALLIFDEVMTGLRVALGGAQEIFGLEPDITCLGKVIGGGLPVGAYGGKRAIMELVAPQGPVYQAGTLSGNPLAMSAGLATLDVLLGGQTFVDTCILASRLVAGIQQICDDAGVPMQTGHAGTMFGFYFLKQGGVAITDYASAVEYADTKRYGEFFHSVLERGVYFAPSQFEAGFMSAAHTDQDIDVTLDAVRSAVAGLAA
jgi:glutamate-1-semialdehyde 2,1-aminomutase